MILFGFIIASQHNRA